MPPGRVWARLTAGGLLKAICNAFATPLRAIRGDKPDAKREKPSQMSNSQSQDIARAVASQRRSSFSAIANFNTDSLARALNGFRVGDLREAAQLWQQIAGVDDILVSVKPKRETVPAYKDHVISPLDKSPQAQAHKKILQEFWSSLEVVDAWDRNRKGGLRFLLKSAMEAVSYHYAAFHLSWLPSAERLRCRIEYVPLWFFENRTGELRFLQNGYGTQGAELDPGDWEVHSGGGLMLACSICVSAKRLVYQDWLAFSEKFSIPSTIGRTPASPESAAGLAMATAVAAVTSDFSAVIYNDDGKSKIEFLEPKGSPNGMPMPGLIERVDRRMSAIYRGADLSTMSSSAGAGTGASLQAGETEILEQDDCASLTEFLRRIERKVIEWYDGPDAEPAAQSTIICPRSEDQRNLLTAVKTFVGFGARLSIADVLGRFNMAEAAADERILKPEIIRQEHQMIEESDAQDKAEETQYLTPNADAPKAAAPEEALFRAAGDLLSEASVKDLDGLTERLRAILLNQDAGLRRAQLTALSEDLPTYMEQTERSEIAWQRVLAAAFLEGLEDLEETEESAP